MLTSEHLCAHYMCLMILDVLQMLQLASICIGQIYCFILQWLSCMCVRVWVSLSLCVGRVYWWILSAVINMHSLQMFCILKTTGNQFAPATENARQDGSGTKEGLIQQSVWISMYMYRRVCAWLDKCKFASSMIIFSSKYHKSAMAQ